MAKALFLGVVSFGHKINFAAILDFCCFHFPLSPAITKIINSTPGEGN
jgi:hypothetical protein